MFVLLPLIGALGMAAPAQAATSWGSISRFSALSACAGIEAADPATTATDSTAAPPSGWQNTPQSVTVDGTGDHMEWMLDCGRPQTTAAFNTPVAVSSDGSHVFSHRAVDLLARGTAWIDETVMVDATVPINTTSVSSLWRNTPLTVTLTGSDATSGLNRMEYDLDGGGWTPAPSVMVSGDGDHTLLTRAVDNAGNVSSSQTDHVRIDSVLPADNTVTPIGWQYAPTSIDVTGADAGSGVSVVRWRIDGGTITSGADHSSVNMPEGAHTISTQVQDNAGNTSSWWTRTVQVDLSGPTDTTTTPVGWQQTGQTIHVTGDDTNGSGIEHVEWDLDGVLGSGPDNSTVQINADGVHTLKTRVFDYHGSTSGWATRTVKVDTVRPTDSTSVSAGWSTAPVAVDVTGFDQHSGIDHVEWILDGASSSSTSTSNPKTVTVSGDGVHTLKTRVWDVAGWSSNWTTWTIKIDTTAPVNATPVAPTAWRTTAYPVVLSGNDGGAGLQEMRYEIDGGPTQAVPSGTQVSVSGTGSHTLTTWAVDLAGNASTPRIDTVNIDTVTPTDTTTAPGAPIANGGTVAVTGTDAHSGVDHVEWQIDQGALQTGPSGSAATFVGGGTHQLQTRVVDAAGNTSTWKLASVTVDTSADTSPPTDTTTTVSAVWKTANLNVTVSGFDAGSGVAIVEWRLDGSPIHIVSPGTVVAVAGDGTHTLETRVTDNNGNVSTWRAQTINIDTAVPVDTTTVPSGWANSQTLALTATDATSGVASWEYQLDGGAPATLAVGGSVTFAGDGTHTLRRRVLDAAGQASAWKTDTIKIDSVLPANTSPVAPTAWQTSALSLALTGTDALSGFGHAEWRVDGGAVQTGSPAVVSADGTHLLETRAVDAAGNVSAWRTETVKIDTTAPVNTTAHPSAAWLRSTYSVTVAGTDSTSGVSRVEWRLDGGSTFTTPSASVVATGAHTLSTRVVDVAGNASAWRADSVGIDKNAPLLSVDCGSNAWRNTIANCSVAADGGESGLALLTAARDGGIPADVAGNAYSVGDDGDWTLAFRAVDNAGNEQTGTARVRVDRTPPVPTVSCTPGTGTGYVCHAAGTDALSGMAGLSWSLNGAAALPTAADGTFAVAKGSVVVIATDTAGNAAGTAAAKLADRTASSTSTPTSTTTSKPQPVARSVSEAVLRSGRGSVAARVLGEISLTSLPTASTADLRPLALGKGTFRIQMKMKADKSTKTVTKTVVTKSGYSPRISMRMNGAAHIQVDLTVRRKVGSRWRTHASGGAELS